MDDDKKDDKKDEKKAEKWDECLGPGVHLDDKESDEKKAEKWDECLGPKCSWMKRRPTSSGNRDECSGRALVAVTR